MGKKKSSQTTNQQTSQQSSGSTSGAYASQNTFGEYTPSDTKDIQSFRDWKPEIDPGLSYQYSSARNKLQQSLIDPTGGYLTPAMKDAILRNKSRDLNQDEAQAYRSGQYDVNQIRSGQLGSLAALTRPQLVQTGSSGISSGQSQGNMSGTMSGTGTFTQPSNLFGDILGAASQVGSVALM